MKPVRFAYADPRSVEEALALLAEHGEDAKLLAGGQSLVPLLNLRLARPSVLIDLNRVAGLEGIRLDDGVLRVGAMTRQRTLEKDPAVRTRCPLLVQALHFVGHPPIRHRGTVGGSLAHADPAAELPAALACLGGEVVARSRAGERVIAAAEFFRGLMTTALRPDEILTEVRFRLPSRSAGWAFLEVARRHGDFALVGVAVLVEAGPDRTLRDVRVSVFGVGSTPVRARAAERELEDQELTPGRLRRAAELVSGTLRPDSDIHASADYRREVAGVLTRRALALAVQRGGDGVRGGRGG
ncbi:MAG: xanthine dehydrogenase family protein subunit M [Candidatus Rokubacteria bacterium]|nr:xanthine dehydrogenase family protein subunit M [Candidatus Rokubacteria bacterium]